MRGSAGEPPGARPSGANPGARGRGAVVLLKALATGRTMQPPNPYAPPMSDPSQGQNAGFHGFGVWQQAGCAVLYCTGAMLPNRCVVCNAPGKHRVQKTFFWHEPWIYVLILGGVLIY